MNRLVVFAACLVLVSGAAVENRQTYDHGHFKFTCQHGPKECVGNILHSCAIHEACGNKGTFHCPVHKLKMPMNYINCVVQQQDQQAASDKCATDAGLTPDVINKCANSKLGEVLESRYGNETKAFRPKVNYVAFIAVNNKHDANIQNQAETDLKGLICSYLPHLCK
ncbi:hypothetical protein J6590_033333 [Homalodisca vitripennis]|nr:hypothetical protein J6590_033333 [Homalodisca vitripennis]